MLGIAVFALPMGTFRIVAAAALLVGLCVLYGLTADADARPLATPFIGLPLVAAATATIGTAIYYASSLDTLGRIIMIVGVALLPAVIARIKKDGEPEVESDGNRRPNKPIRAALLLAASAAAAIVAMHYTLGSATDAALRSPWEVAPTAFFSAMFAAALATALAAFNADDSPVAVPAAMLLTAAATTVAYLIYRIGFGFDPFLHGAAEKFILAHGAITPKTPYYIGQYAITVIASAMTGIDVTAIDRALVPFALPAILPFIAWCARKMRAPFLGVAALALIMPIAWLTVTTPQYLAYVFLFLTSAAVVASTRGSGVPLWVAALFACGAATIHPLAGIPALTLAAIAYAATTKRFAAFSEFRLALTLAAIGIAASVIVPGMFWLNSGRSAADAAFGLVPGVTLSSALSDMLGRFVLARRFLPALDIAYMWQAIRIPAIIVCALGAVFADRERRRTAWIWVAATLSLVSTYLLLTFFFNFAFLIDYERQNYSSRTIDMLAITLAPLALFGAASWIARLREAAATTKLMAAALIATGVVSAAYLAYPRYDLYEASRGWSTSASDIVAVRAIDANAGDAPYIVLADQSVSAAAIREFGFKRYFDSRDAAHPSQLFYYPVPTGSALYQSFLDMNAAHGSAETAHAAMDLAGVDELYFVVNDYWWQSSAIAHDAKTSADSWWKPADDITIFKYTRKRARVCAPGSMQCS